MVTNCFLIVTDLWNFFPKIPNKCLSFLTKSQHSIPLVCYIILVIKRLTTSQSSWSSVRKNVPYKILAFGNCSAEIFGCSIEFLIPWEIMTSSEMIFQFQEIIGVLI